MWDSTQYGLQMLWYYNKNTYYLTWATLNLLQRQLKEKRWFSFMLKHIPSATWEIPTNQI